MDILFVLLLGIGLFALGVLGLYRAAKQGNAVNQETDPNEGQWLWTILFLLFWAFMVYWMFFGEHSYPIWRHYG